MFIHANSSEPIITRVKVEDDNKKDQPTKSGEKVLQSEKEMKAIKY